MDGQNQPNNIQPNISSNGAVTPPPTQLSNQPSRPSDNSPIILDNSKSRKSSKILIGTICGIAGIIIGAASYFGITKILNNNQTNCECDCPGSSTTSQNSIDLGFLNLETNEQNLIYSPLSIKNGLGLLKAGAAGTTKTQIENILGDSEPTKYNNIEDKLSLANSIFIRDTFKGKVLESYINTVSKDYNAEVNYDSFTNGNAIDSWVNNKTFGLINNLGLQPDASTKMVLVNALAIQMSWESPFGEAYPKKFYQVDNSEIQVNTLSEETTSDSFSYYLDDNTTALAMDLITDSYWDYLYDDISSEQDDDYLYDDTGSEQTDGVELQFVAIMPKGNLTDYIKSTSTDNINQIVDQLKSATEPKDGIYAQIPKFKFDYELNFKTDLQSLGITTAFTDDADFSNMASESLKVDDAIHKANIDFSEDGIKAAATTAFDMVVGAMAEEEEPQPIDVIIDHPFLFLIRDKATGEIWFIGTVYNPSASSES